MRVKSCVQSLLKQESEGGGGGGGGVDGGWWRAEDTIARARDRISVRTSLPQTAAAAGSNVGSFTKRERERERHLRSRSISRDLWIIARLIPARGENLSPNRWREDATRIRSMTWRISTDLGLLKIGNHRIWRKMIHRPTDGTEILKFLLKGPGI